MKNSMIGALCLSLAASIWGGMYVISKYVLEFVPPISLIWLRYAVAFVILLAIVKISERKTMVKTPICKKDWMQFAWIGFIGYFISITFQFMGTKLSDAHTGALITSAAPVFIVLFARIILEESVTLQKIIALSLSLIGLIIVNGWGEQISNMWGNLFLIGAAVTWALLSIYVKRASEHLSSLYITTYAVGFAWLFTTPFMIYEASYTPFSLTSNNFIVPGILYMGIVSTAGAFFLWNKGMELMDAGIGSLFFFIQPVVGSFLGWLLLHERLDYSFFLGGAFILSGVLIVTIPKNFRSFISKMEARS